MGLSRELQVSHREDKGDFGSNNGIFQDILVTYCIIASTLVAVAGSNQIKQNQFNLV